MRLGVGVSLQAQALYDTLSKTLPCRWQGTSIVVLGEVCPGVVPDVDTVNNSVILCFKLTVEDTSCLLHSSCPQQVCSIQPGSEPTLIGCAAAAICASKRSCSMLHIATRVHREQCLVLTAADPALAVGGDKAHACLRLG